MDLTPNEIYNLVIYQLGALSGFCKINHVKMMHVKPHGALYQMGLEIKKLHMQLLKQFLISTQI